MIRIWFAVFAAALVISGCSGIKVNQDYDPTTDFASMKTYRWAAETQEKTGELRVDNPLRDTRIRAAVDRLLNEKGFRKFVDGSPTFLVRYQYVLRQKIGSDGGGIGFGIGSFGSHGGIAIGTGNSVRAYDEGALTIDFVDAASQSLLWRGTGTQPFREYDDPKKTNKDINLLVEKILAQFPPAKPE
ncbi:DUF4136 domain-containing protein [uncultured Desulfosarcina sp.]|uniref:DUF4136 domain-containing protein n=1 Tax=uncultured Desulfosarcina sp. TaxID=218289 RepID=UPI0029C883FC|nr:DUF4136 domain-containing protein [uncultured Desulfosarcina sp.]